MNEYKVKVSVPSTVADTTVSVPLDELVDMHIMEHGKFLGVGPEGAQQGDTRAPTQSKTPEIQRLMLLQKLYWNS